jgi:hypothetical protein
MSERFVSPSPPMSGHPRELLTILIEECAEVQQRATKALRFGIDEVQPGQTFTNAERLAAELGDLIEMVERVKAAGLVLQRDIDMGRRHKQHQLEIYMQEDAA